MPCSNECPSAPALELCETVEEASLRLLAEFRVRVQKTRAVLRDLKRSGPITRPHAAHLRRRGAAAAMLPMRDFRRRRRRRFAALGQPLLFWLAALLVQAAAQPHAREHHAQHIMNQARAHQKACGCSVSSQSRRARSAERHAVEQYITSHRWRAGLDNVAEWRRVAGAGPTHERNNAGARSSSASGSAASTRRARRLQKPTT